MSNRMLRNSILSASSAIALSGAAALTPAALAQTVINNGDNQTVTSQADGETITAGLGVVSEVTGAPVVVANNNDVVITNAGTLRTLGLTQTIQAGVNTNGVSILNAPTGILEAESRVIDILGDGVTVTNEGIIRGIGDQRNGTVYANATANNFSILNDGSVGSTALIDAGVGNQGAGIAIEVGNGGNPVSGSISNLGQIIGRGQGAASSGLAGDGIRFFGPGFQPVYEFDGDISNFGLISSEGASGTVAGVRFANQINFTGTLENNQNAIITGVNNGLYFGEADHTGGVVNNAGIISSNSRALNIDGIGLVVNNSGSILGLGNQRNGTVYADATAQDFTLDNSGLIDAGAGNEGAGFSAELSEAGNDFTIINSGDIVGRGNAGAGLATAGDGLRFERTRVAGALDGTTTGLFTGTITNSGNITSEAANGTAGAIRFVNGVSFQGTLTNEAGGVISGVQNGLYFGNPTPAGGGDHTGGVVNNAGIISSNSRALNIDGIGLVVNNSGDILGLGDQRNGTVYADATAQDFVFNNLETGSIDAGENNEGSGFGAEIAAGGNTFILVNAGEIIGRGNAAASTNAAGDGIRIGNVGNAGIANATITNSGTILSEGENGTVSGLRVVNGVGFQGTITNQQDGFIGGIQNGVYFGDADHTGGVLTNEAGATIASLSRALNIDGTGLEINNAGLITGQVIDPDDGSIIDQGAQRNGTVYADATAQDFTLNNSGLIDAGAGNEGAGFSAELSEAGNNFTIINSGDIVGRGNAGAGLATAGDGLRFERTRVAGALDGTTTGLFTGTITNSGNITSEAANGTAGAIRFVNGVSFQGTLTNEAGGVISGVQNGLYFGNPTPAGGGDHTGGVVNNAGIISSNSRALNIDGVGLVVNNSGDILGLSDQRNGTVYADATAQDFTLDNSGLIDAGAGNEGAGFSAELSEAGNNFTIINSGDIVGRGNAGAGLATAGDGLRFERTRVAGALDGTTTGLFTGTITNSGNITSEAANGTAGAIRFVNGVSFQGTLTNEAGGVISGVQNGLYFGNPTPAGGGDHTGGVVNNAGIISSNSRALNIDGIGLVVNNSGSILGLGNQRNGTVYADATAQDFTLNNSGLIDAGAGNEGAGFSVELSDAGNEFTLINSGDIVGRGNAGAGLATAGDGLRFERTRVAGALDGTTTGLFTGTITNSGNITSEAANGTAGAIRFVNGVSFQGTLTNEAGGVISGVQNGLYFGNPTPAGGGDHTGGVVNNAGIISSNSRALNIDGIGLVVNNSGSILGLGNQRNGTVYADGTADNYTFNNLAGGVVDAGIGNQGSGVSLQTGTLDGDIRTVTFNNAGTIAGRGDALTSGASAGLRLFNGAGAGTTVTLDGDIINSGTISSETSAAILIENLAVNGTFVNSGTLEGATAFDALSALRAITFIQNGGSLQGDFIGSSFTDDLTFASGSSLLNGNIIGDVTTTIADGANLTVNGNRTLAGDLLADGTLNFNLGTDSLAVDGNTVFGANSIVNVATNLDVNSLVLGSPISVISETGTFTNNGLTVNINEDDFLVDYLVSLGSVSVTPVAVDLAAVSTDTNISAFGGALTNTFAGGALDPTVATALNGLTSTAGFEGASNALLPSINEGITREIFETQGLANSFIDRRLKGEGTGAWVQALYRTANRDAESTSVTGYDADAFAFTLGVDRRLSSSLTAGVAFNYASIDVDEIGGSGEVSEIDSYQISGYAGLDAGSTFANVQLGYIFSDVNSSRTGLTGPVSSASDVNGFNALGTVGVDINSGSLTLTPQATIHYTNLSQDSFAENGDLNLNVDADDVSFLDLKAGFEASANYGSAGWTIRPVIRAAYVYDAIGDARVLVGNIPAANSTTALAGSNFTLTSFDPAQSRAEFGAGLGIHSGNGFSFDIEYDGEAASNYSSHGGFVRLRVNF